MKKTTISWIFLTTLTLIFAVAKLYGAVAWSWLWVISPICAPIAMLVALTAVAAVLSYLFTILFID